jgi:UDP-GlcNAc:undecaprenyl-phosphate GlcNAc-1-phosphate transferase
MYQLLLLGGFSFVLSLFLVPLCRDAALRWKLVDYPDQARKIHRLPIPRIGGVPLIVAALVSSLLAYAVGTRLGAFTEDMFHALGLLAFPALAAFLLGLFDDVAGMKATHKLAGQVAAALAAFAVGIRIQSIGGISLDPWTSGLVTVLWLVACANAMNLIDGVDGLASGVALVVSGTSIAGALLTGHVELAVALAPIAGGLIGFLVFNFNPASIFLGDCGSLLLGILLGCHGVLLSHEPSVSRGMLAPLIALSIPLVDLSLAVARRFLRRQPIFSADRSHIHHRLLALGLKPRSVVMVLCGAEAVAGLLALWVGITRHRWDMEILALFACAVGAGIARLEYAEFSAVRRFFRDDLFRHAVSGHVAVRQFEDVLTGAATPQECWRAVEATSKALGVHRAEMRIGGYTFRYHGPSSAIRAWQIHVPISEVDWVEFYQDSGRSGEGHATAMIAFAETIRRLLSSRSFISPRPPGNGLLITSSIVAQENLARAAAGSQGTSH